MPNKARGEALGTGARQEGEAEDASQSEHHEERHHSLRERGTMLTFHFVHLKPQLFGGNCLAVEQLPLQKTKLPGFPASQVGCALASVSRAQPARFCKVGRSTVTCHM